MHTWSVVPGKMFCVCRCLWLVQGQAAWVQNFRSQGGGPEGTQCSRHVMLTVKKSRSGQWPYGGLPVKPSMMP